MDRLRGRRLAGLALAAVLAVTIAGAAATALADSTRWIVVRDDAGAELARARLPSSGILGMRYRNSVYRSLAEEQFRVMGDHLELVELRADELAVLEEYYTADGGARHQADSTLAWRIAVERPPVPLPLRVQATALGERTLLAGETRIPLWQLVAGRDDTVVVLTIEGGGGR